MIDFEFGKFIKKDLTTDINNDELEIMNDKLKS